MSFSAAVDASTSEGQPAAPYLDRGLAGAGDGAALIEIGNPANPRLRLEWERANGKPWPRDPKTGRNYDVGHRKAIADGGTNTLDNIEPIHPDEHRARHKADGDYARWGRRAATARAFGGRVVRGLGLPDSSVITGILSGRIRTDTFDNFVGDMFGFPSKEDQRKAYEEWQRSIKPDRKPGEMFT